MRKKTQGFTLVEMLVALFIFAIVGVLAAISLHSLLRVNQDLKHADKKIMSEQMALVMLRRDLQGAIDRPVRDANNQLDPSFLAQNNTLVFTKIGFNLQRVGYALQQGCLMRLTWRVLDPTKKTAMPAEKKILCGVASVQWQLMSDTGKLFYVWPSSSMSALPRVVLLVMKLNNNDVIQGIFPIPARGSHA